MLNNKLQYISFFILIFNIISCQEKQKINIVPNMEQDNKMIKNVLEKQLKQGANTYIDEPGVEIPKKAFDLDELNVSMLLVDSLVKSAGYKTPTQSEFNEKIKLKLNRIIDNNSEKQYLYINFLDKCDRNFIYFPSNGIEHYGIYIDKVRKIVSGFYYIPELIDYQKYYPEVSKIENKVSLHYTVDEDSYTIELWKDLASRTDEYNLSKKRRFNQQLVIARNKYLFNDDKSQFPWLITNDENFMKFLVTDFGYTKDKKLLKWAFEKEKFRHVDYPSNDMMESYGKFLWTKQCNGDIKLHPNTLELIKELSSPKVNQDYYILNVVEYINYLTTSEVDNGLTFAQKAKIVATLLAFGEQYKYNKAYGFNQMFLGKFIYYQDTDKKYKKEFERNNYYNLPNLKEWYLKAEQEKDIFENDQSLSDDPQPNNYLYKATYYKGPYSK